MSRDWENIDECRKAAPLGTTLAPLLERLCKKVLVLELFSQ
jgi:hypothetical protein